MSWVATITAAPAAASCSDPRRRARPCGARSMPRVGSSSSTTARSVAGRAPPRARAAGARRRTGRAGSPRSRPASPAARHARRPRPPRRRARGSGSRPGSAAAAPPRPARSTRPRVGSTSPFGEPQQRALAGAVAPHQRHPLAGLAARSVDAAQDRSGPSSISCQTSRTTSAGWAASRGRSRRAAGTVSAAARMRHEQPAPRSPRARLLHRRRQRAQPGEREQPRRGRGQRRGAASAAQARNSRGAASQATRPLDQRDHAVGRGQAALQPVLGHHAPAVPQSSFSRRSSQTSSSPATGSSCEVGSSSSSSGGPVHHRGGDRHALELAAGQRVGAPVEQMRRRRARAPSPPPRARPRRPARRGARAAAPARPARRPSPPASRAPGSTVPQTAASSPGPWSRTSSPPTRQLAARLAAVEVRHQPAERAQQRGLARARHARRAP